MNAKYALALILALQVSMSLCEIPAPSDELLHKYEEYEKTFIQRLLTAYRRVQTAVAPVVAQIGESEPARMAREYGDELQVLPKLTTLSKVFEQALVESAKMAQNARSNALSLYEQYLREYVGEFLSDGIDKAKVYLNMYLPAEPVPEA